MRPYALVLLSLAACADVAPDDKTDTDTDTTGETDETDSTDETDVEEATPSAFQLRFEAAGATGPVACGTDLAAVGPEAGYTVGLNDLRFYVSNIVFRDEAGDVVDATYDEDDFQYTGTAGWVGLVDLTSNTGGACADGSISFSEGTARTHNAITGTAIVEHVASVSFDVGVPQALMKEVISNNTIEGAPSPLAEMHWSWASGCRHFVFNFTLSDLNHTGEGYLHVGSTGCAGEGELALESKTTCDYVNTPHVMLDGFSLADDTIAVDLAALLADLDFSVPDVHHGLVPKHEGGEKAGVECHSSPDQGDCGTFYGNLGLDIATGTADAATNTVFHTK